MRKITVAEIVEGQFDAADDSVFEEIIFDNHGEAEFLTCGSDVVRYEFPDGSAVVLIGGPFKGQRLCWGFGVHRSRLDDARVRYQYDSPYDIADVRFRIISHGNGLCENDILPAGQTFGEDD